MELNFFNPSEGNVLPKFLIDDCKYGEAFLMCDNFCVSMSTAEQLKNFFNNPTCQAQTFAGIATADPEKIKITVLPEIPIIDGKIIEFENNNYLKAIGRFDGTMCIDVDNGRKITKIHHYRSSSAVFQRKVLRYDDELYKSYGFNIKSIQDFASSDYFYQALCIIGENPKNFNARKEIGAFAITHGDKIWVCYRKSAQKVSDLENWLLALYYERFCFTDDKDLVQSIMDSGGNAGCDIN